jgi:hypothetical protein
MYLFWVILLIFLGRYSWNIRVSISARRLLSTFGHDVGIMDYPSDEDFEEYGYRTRQQLDTLLHGATCCDEIEKIIHMEASDMKGLVEALRNYNERVTLKDICGVVDGYSPLDTRQLEPCLFESSRETRFDPKTMSNYLPERESVGRIQVAGRARKASNKRVQVMREDGILLNFGNDAACFSSAASITFMAVADGVGNRKRPDLASRVAVACARLAFDSAPHVRLSEMAFPLLLNIQNLLAATRVRSGTTIVMARVDQEFVEIVSVGDSTAIVVDLDGVGWRTGKGEHAPNTPFCLRGDGPAQDEHIHYYTFRTRDTAAVYLLTDGVTDNLFLSDIVGEDSAARIAAKAVAVFTEKMAPTPYKSGERGKPDDVTVAMLKLVPI